MDHPEGREMWNRRLADETGFVALEVGDSKLDDKMLQDMAPGPGLAHAAYPKARILIMIGGFDEDPRSLWDIPEVVDYVQRFARAAGLHDWRSSLFNALDEETKALLLKCGAVQEPHPFKVVIG